MDMTEDPIPVLIIDRSSQRIGKLARVSDEQFELQDLQEISDDGLAAISASSSGIEAIIFDGDTGFSKSDGALLELLLPPDKSKVPLMLLTGDGSHPVAEHIAREAAYELRKPVNDKTLCAVVRAAVFEQEKRSQLRAEVRKRTSAVGHVRSGQFRIRTLEEAENLATMLSLSCPEPERVALGARELFVNAIEHGNLEIGYERKSVLLADGTWQTEIERRLEQAPFKDRFVLVDFDNGPSGVTIRVTDQGKGFDYRRFEEHEGCSDCGLHGRGLLFARKLAFDDVRFEGAGNIVEARMHFDGAR